MQSTEARHVPFATSADSGLFAADALNANRVAACFTVDAVVIDEGRTYQGRSEIAAWKADTSERYRYSAEPIALERDGEKRTVTARLTGDFPGSPVDLRYAFDLAGDEIARLEITA